jgi:hypothetical protein
MAKTTKSKKAPKKAGGDTHEADMRKEDRIDDNAAYIVIPDVTDIPGQEHIIDAGVPAEMADTTISSDDEEGIRDGKDILEEDENDLDIVMGTEADVTKEDLAMLGRKDQDMDMGEDEFIRKEGLDDRDNEGELLNEAPANVDSTGEDLDIPDSEEGKRRGDALDQGDEENDYYSLGSDKNDNLDESNP